MMLWDYLKENMLKCPQQTVSECGAEMSFEELVVFAEQFAAELIGEECCAVYCHSEMAAAMAVLGCTAAGVTAVPMSPRYGETHSKKILKHVSPSCLVTDIEGELGIFRITDSAYQPPDAHPAFIMCTSGTTGIPKGVMLSEKNIMQNVRGIAEYFSIGEGDTILITRPLYHCAVLSGEFFTALVKGTKIVFSSEAFNPAMISEIIKKRGITVFCGTPTLLCMFAQTAGRCAGGLIRHIAVSGECMSAACGREIRDAFPGARIYHVYGLTEAGPRVSFLAPEYFDLRPDFAGVPLSSVELKIADGSGGQAAPGEYGELWVKSESVMLGYYKDRELTDKTLQGGWLRTGDIACIDENGFLKIKGRSDDMIIRAGMNIYPQEIEAELKKDRRVREAAVYGYRSGGEETRIGLRISGEFEDVGEVKRLCINALSPYQIPSKIELVDELQKNASGKILRRYSDD